MDKSSNPFLRIGILNGCDGTRFTHSKQVGLNIPKTKDYARIKQGNGAVQFAFGTDGERSSDTELSVNDIENTVLEISMR